MRGAVGSRLFRDDEMSKNAVLSSVTVHKLTRCGENQIYSAMTLTRIMATTRMIRLQHLCKPRGRG
jgi:hypothetical protein